MLSFVGPSRLPVETGPAPPYARERADPTTVGGAVRSRVGVVGSNRRGRYAGLSVRDPSIAGWDGLVC